MIHKTFLLLFLFISAINYSQTSNSKITFEKNDKLVYLDSAKFVTSEKNYQFYRIVKEYKLDKSSYAVYEFNKLGFLQLEGITLNKEEFRKEGVITYYYENGKKKAVTSYAKGRPNGIDIQWYENGNKKLEGIYIANEEKRTSQYKIDQFWDVNSVQKVVDGNGFFEDQDENEYSKGEIKNGFKEGNWEGTLKKPQLSYKETYKYGKLVSGESIEGNGDIHIYKEVEIAPEPRNGIEDFYNFVGRNYRTPNVQGLKGKIYLTFVIDKKGRVVEPKVLRDLGYGTGKEAIRVVTKYDGFRPGEQRGRKVRCTYSLPISIQSAY
nr:energy transducer TonB [uncultured Flavobacterium sp.]